MCSCVQLSSPLHPVRVFYPISVCHCVRGVCVGVGQPKPHLVLYLSLQGLLLVGLVEGWVRRARSHTRPHVHTCARHTHGRMRARTHTHTATPHSPTHTHAPPPSHTHAGTHINPPTRTHTHARTHEIPTCVRARRHVRKCARAHTVFLHRVMSVGIRMRLPTFVRQGGKDRCAFLALSVRL